MYSHEEQRKGGYTIPGKKVRKDDTISPGPGAYEQTLKSVKVEEYSHKIGTS